jgi:hypothetical protein
LPQQIKAPAQAGAFLFEKIVDAGADEFRTACRNPETGSNKPVENLSR